MKKTPTGFSVSFGASFAPGNYTAVSIRLRPVLPGLYRFDYSATGNLRFHDSSYRRTLALLPRSTPFFDLVDLIDETPYPPVFCEEWKYYLREGIYLSEIWGQVQGFSPFERDFLFLSWLRFGEHEDEWQSAWRLRYVDPQWLRALFQKHGSLLCKESLRCLHRRFERERRPEIKIPFPEGNPAENPVAEKRPPVVKSTEPEITPELWRGYAWPRWAEGEYLLRLLKSWYRDENKLVFDPTVVWGPKTEERPNSLSFLTQLLLNYDWQTRDLLETVADPEAALILKEMERLAARPFRRAGRVPQKVTRQNLLPIFGWAAVRLYNTRLRILKEQMAAAYDGRDLVGY